jgi:hypothetical protein
VVSDGRSHFGGGFSLARVVCYSGGRNLDNLVVGDGGSHFGGGFSAPGTCPICGKSFDSQVPPHFGGGFSSRPAMEAAMAPRKHLPTSVGVSLRAPPWKPRWLLAKHTPLRWGFLGPAYGLAGDGLANTSPLRWGLIYGHRQRSGHAYLAKQAPPRWGFLGLWRVVVDGLPNVTRKHLPTSVGVSPLGKPYLLSLTRHLANTSPLWWG